MNFPIKPSEIEALTALARSPAALKTIQDHHAKLVAERTARVARIKALDAQASIDWPRGQAAIAKAIEGRERAIRALRDADAELAKANAESFNKSAEYARSRQSEESALIADADLATIEAFKNDCLRELENLCRPSVIVSNVVVTRSEATGKPIRSGVSNMASIVARMAAVRAAYHDAESLKWLPDQRKLASTIDAIRAEFPLVDQNPQPPKVTQS
jgi:hypothetical protein